jgi:hypothetical protein
LRLIGTAGAADIHEVTEHHLVSRRVMSFPSPPGDGMIE